MEKPAGLGDILATTSVDISWLLLLFVGGAVYLYGATRPAARRGRKPHSLRATFAFILGLVMLWVGTQSPLQHYGNTFVWANFTSFLFVTMIAAPLLVAGSPLTLAFRVSGKERRRQLRWLYQRSPFSWLFHPVSAWLLFAVVTYLWQFSGLTEAAAKNGLVRDIQFLTLLLVGIIFWTPALCADPVRWRMAFPLRGLYVLVEMVHKGLFGGMFLSMETPFHDHFADNLPAWGPSAMDDQRIGIVILWIGGNVIFVAVLAAIAVSWVRYEARNSARVDRRLALANEARRRRRAALDQVFQKNA
jgi:cytochrome c oxidase assembly factor CtaG